MKTRTCKSIIRQRRDRSLHLERLEDRRLLAGIAFDPPVNLPIPGTSSPATGDVLVADFNEDGHADIVSYFNDGAYPSNPARIVVFASNGPASFNSPTVLTQTPGCWASPNGTLQLGDLNQDGHLDFTMTHGGSNRFCFGNKVTTHLGDGTGSFALAQTFSTGGSIAKHILGDFTNDNQLDLVIPTYDSDRMFLYRGNGNGQIGSITAAIGGVEPTGLVVHDFDRDGNLDLATADGLRGRDFIRIYSGNGNGGLALTQQIQITTAPPDGLVSGDVNNDGILDLVAVSTSTGNISVLAGRTDGTFEAAVTIGTGLGSHTFRNEPVLGDFDLDGNLDIVVADPVNTDAIHIMLGDGSGDFAAPIAVPFGAGTDPGVGMKAADVNLDGKLDIVTTGSNGVYYLLNAVVTNKDPVAIDDAYEINEDGTLNVAQATGVLANDSDPDLDSLSVTQVISGPSSGTLSLGTDGSFTYTPYANFNGTDSFTYEISDGNGGLATALVRIHVLSAREQINGVFSDVQSLVAAGVLNKGQGNSLTAKLENALDKLDRGTAKPAINQLAAFIHEIEAFVTGGVLDDGDGEDLLDQIARAIVSAG